MTKNKDDLATVSPTCSDLGRTALAEEAVVRGVAAAALPMPDTLRPQPRVLLVELGNTDEIARLLATRHSEPTILLFRPEPPQSVTHLELDSLRDLVPVQRENVLGALREMAETLDEAMDAVQHQVFLGTPLGQEVKERLRIALDESVHEAPILVAAGKIDAAIRSAQEEQALETRIRAILDEMSSAIAQSPKK